MTKNQGAFDELKSLLLAEERHENQRITESLREELLEKVAELESELNDPNRFASKIEGAKGEIVDVLGPVMGKMIRKYIQNEIALINEKIETSKDKIFSSQFWVDKFRFGKKTSPITTMIDNPIIKEILIIGKDSGLLLGQYAQESISDVDMVSGMLTAIKSFVETTFDSNIENELGMIDYGDYKIMIHGQGTYYYAVIFKGTAKRVFQEIMIEELDQFSVLHLKSVNQLEVDRETRILLQEEMISYFNETCKKLEKRLYS